MHPFAGAVSQNFHLINDNGRPHTAHIATKWLDNEGNKVLSWAA